LHATFRRSGRVDAEQGFDIDYYDLHRVPRALAVTNDSVWRADLFGGGRTLALADRLKEFRTLQQYASEHHWDFGEGFIQGGRGISEPSGHVIGKPFLPSEALTASGIDDSAITVAPRGTYERPRSEGRFSPPILLIREHMDIPHALRLKGYLTYTKQIVGFPAAKNDVDKLTNISQWLSTQEKALQAYIALTSPRLFTQKATALQADDIYSIPYPETDSLDLSGNEQILVHDITDYYRDLIRLGEDSNAMKEHALSSLTAFGTTFIRQINAIYKENPLRVLESYSWRGAICVPFLFGSGKVDWSGADELQGKLDKLLHEQRGTTLHITRIARIYDGKFIFLLKPDRLRYWLRSVALRDADETLSDLRGQGF